MDIINNLNKGYMTIKEQIEQKLSKKTITLLELATIIQETTVEAQLNFWQKASDYQKGLLKNLKNAGFNLIK